MTWRLIDEFQPTWDWQTTESPIVGASAIKIEQDWSYAGVFPGRGFLWLVQQFPDSSFHNFRRVYPYRDPRIFSTVIPAQLEASGWNVYQLALKVNLRATWQDDADWRVRLYEWIGSEPSPLTPFPTTSPSTPGVPDLIYDGGISTV